MTVCRKPWASSSCSVAPHGLDRAPDQCGRSVGISRPARRKGKQSQHPGGRRRERFVDEPEGAGERAGTRGLLPRVRQAAQPLGHIGDRRPRPGGQPAADQDQCGGQSAALLGDGLGGLRIHGDPHRAGEGAEQLDRGLGVHAAEGARPYVGNPGERALGHGDDQAVGVVRQQRVDLLGVPGVVEEQQRAAYGERLADHLGQLVLVRAGR